MSPLGLLQKPIGEHSDAAFMSKVRFLVNPSEFNSALVVRAHIRLGRSYRLMASPPAESQLMFCGRVCAKHGITTFALRNSGHHINCLDHFLAQLCIGVSTLETIKFQD